MGNDAVMADTPVVITTKGRRYHVDESCPGYQQGIVNAEKRGMTVHAPSRVTEATATLRGKTACLRCGGGR